VREGVLATTVYFATNRIVTNPSDPDGGYTSAIVPPLKPEEITYGTAIIDGIDIATNAHGFDNTFSDALARAAFNREWLAASGLPGTNTTVVAFSWPSSGRVVGYPVAAEVYLADRNMAQSSGIALMSFLANLEPLIGAARAGGYRVTLLAHSMGNLALEAGVVG